MRAHFICYQVILVIFANSLLLAPVSAIANPSLLKRGVKADMLKWNPKRAFNLQNDALQRLMLALYECKPQELQKNTQVSKQEYVQWVFEGPFDWKFDTIRQLQSVDALQLSLSPDYHGDRILPLVTGLHTMLLKAYGGQTEYLFSENANPQYLNIASKNTETSAVKLLSTLDENGQPYLSGDCQKNTQKALSIMEKAIRHDAKINSRTEQKVTTINMQESTSEQTNKFDFIQF